MNKFIKFSVFMVATSISIFSFAEESGDLSQQLANTKCIPKFKDGQLTGYDCEDKTLRQQLGLKQGDVVTTANGVPVESASKALELYNAQKLDGQSQNEVSP